MAPKSKRASMLARVAFLALVVLAAAGAFALGKRQAQGSTEQVAPPARGLPQTSDYHALWVDPENARHLLLGTHAGLYESRDGGGSWVPGPLAGRDVMHIVLGADGALWVAGHNVLARSDDDGLTWRDVRPEGLPHLDLHGFTVDPRGRLFAAAAGAGLYRSTDGGATFSEVSDEVGAGVYGLVAYEDGRLLAAEPGGGVKLSADGGETWSTALASPAVRVGAHPSEPRFVLATGARIWRSEDGGATWEEGFDPGTPFEPVAWSAAEPGVAFTITPDSRTLYRSDDAGKSWAPVR